MGSRHAGVQGSLPREPYEAEAGPGGQEVLPGYSGWKRGASQWLGGLEDLLRTFSSHCPTP